MSICGHGTIDNLPKPAGDDDGGTGPATADAIDVVPTYTRDSGPTIATITTDTFPGGAAQWLYLGEYYAQWNANLPIVFDVTTLAPANMYIIEGYDQNANGTLKFNWALQSTAEPATAQSVAMQASLTFVSEEQRSIKLWLFIPGSTTSTRAKIWIRDGFLKTLPNEQEVFSVPPPGTGSIFPSRFLSPNRAVFATDVLPDDDGVLNCGLSTRRWNVVYAQSIQGTTFYANQPVQPTAVVSDTDMGLVVDAVPVLERTLASGGATLGVDGDALYTALVTVVSESIASTVCPVPEDGGPRSVDIVGLVGIVAGATRRNDQRLLNLEANVGYYPPFGGTGTLGIVAGGVTGYVAGAVTGSASDFEGGGYAPMGVGYLSSLTPSGNAKIVATPNADVTLLYYARDNGGSSWDTIAWAQALGEWVVVRTATQLVDGMSQPILFRATPPLGTLANAFTVAPDPAWVWAPP